ncbi:MAG: ribonuclease P [Candidatus Bathyarchaeia archaeon]
MRHDTRERDIAKQRIERLFTLAEDCFKESPILANRYVGLARRIGMKCRVRIPKPLRMRYCRVCGHFLVPGINSRVRTRPDSKGRVVVTCLNCGEIKRYPMVKEKLKRKGAATG